MDCVPVGEAVSLLDDLVLCVGEIVAEPDMDAEIERVLKGDGDEERVLETDAVAEGVGATERVATMEGVEVLDEKGDHVSVVVPEPDLDA